MGSLQGGMIIELEARLKDSPLLSEFNIATLISSIP